jgi:hypothetical protein
MIAGHEGADIAPCLRSVRDLIDYWVICDTGSGGATPEVIANVLSEIPGELHQREWVDFGHNRSELMDLARDKADYLLLLDADMTLVRHGPMPTLDKDAYVIREVGNLDSGVPRLVRGSRRWWYEGSTYEFLATDSRFTEGELHALAIQRRDDGESRELKLLGNLGILKREVASGQLSPRTAFFLAQTLRDLGRPWPAIEWYRRRVELGGFEQEVFAANFEEGALRVTENFASAVPVLLEAWQRRPTRAEPLHELARAYRDRGDASLAYLFADQGLGIPYPPDAWYVRRWVYEWGLRLERGLAAARLGRVAGAGDDLRAVIATDGVPREIVVLARDALIELGTRDRSNGSRHRRAPVQLAALAPALRMAQIQLEVRPDWPTFNPSIAADDDGFRMIVRTSNYFIDYGVQHEDGIVRNINYLVTLDPTLAVTTVEPIDDRLDGLRRYGSRVLGFEDLRLVRVGERWFASATVSELNPIERREIALLELEGSEVISARPLAGPNPGRHEKNWMPFVHDGELHFIYTCGPMVVLRCDHRTGRLTLAAEGPASELASGFRGGSQGLAVGDSGYLFFVHETDHATGRAIYVHRLIRVGLDLRLNAISLPFTFTGERVEFCGGAAIHGTDLVFSFGVDDAASYLGVLPLADALRTLEAL